MMIRDKLIKEIKEYCSLNNITDINGFINKLVTNGFNIEKYGNKPSFKETIKESPKIEESILQPIVDKPELKPTIMDRNIYDE